MSNDTQQKLHRRHQKLTEESYFPERLGYQDLLILLSLDQPLRQLVREIVTGEEAMSEQDDVNLQPETEVVVQANTASNKLQTPDLFSPWLPLVALIKPHPELCQRWQIADNDGLNLIRLAAYAGQWQSVVSLWQYFLNQAKADSSAITSDDLTLLQGIIDIHNLTHQHNKAALSSPEVGSDYDYEHHQRANPQGEMIASVLMPALINAAGQIEGKPLVLSQ